MNVLVPGSGPLGPARGPWTQLLWRNFSPRGVTRYSQPPGPTVALTRLPLLFYSHRVRSGSPLWKERVSGTCAITPMPQSSSWKGKAIIIEPFSQRETWLSTRNLLSSNLCGPSEWGHLPTGPPPSSSCDPTASSPTQLPSPQHRGGTQAHDASRGADLLHLSDLDRPRNAVRLDLERAIGEKARGHAALGGPVGEPDDDLAAEELGALLGAGNDL